MIKRITLLALNFISINVYSNDSIILKPIEINIATRNALEKINTTLNNPENFLKRFKPAAVEVDSKEVSKNSISFNATKKVAFIGNTLFIKGILNSTENDSICAKEEKGYLISFNFDGSDQDVYENIDRIEVKLCVIKKNEFLVTGIAKVKIIKGNNYSLILGPMITVVIMAQVRPLLRALETEIMSINN